MKQAFLAALALAPALAPTPSALPTAPTALQDPGAQLVAARLELVAPAEDTFVLRGTFPVPKGFHPLANGLTAFGVREHDGSIVKAQVEPVTYYPNVTDGADVVEILARVRRDPSVAPGERLRYDVVWYPHSLPAGHSTPAVTDLANVTHDVPANLRALINNPYSLLVATGDVFGNFYFAEPLRSSFVERTRYGPAATGVRTYSTLWSPFALDPTSGALPHSFGVHAYMTTFTGEEVLMIDLRFNNAADGNEEFTDLDDPLGRKYFTALHLAVPAGWSVVADVEDPFLGDQISFGNLNVRPLVKGMTDGSLHVIPAQGQFHRRLAIAPEGQEQRAKELLAQEGLGFCVPGVDESNGFELLSWWNQDFGHYMPQNHVLPTLDHVGLDKIRTDLAAEHDLLRDYLENGENETLGGTKPEGTYPVKSKVLGWAHPYGVPSKGMVGGSGIHYYEGVDTAAAASIDGYRHSMLVHRMQQSRMPTALYHRDGTPSDLSYWLDTQPDGTPYMPFSYFDGQLIQNSDDPMGYPQLGDGSIQSIQVEYSLINGKQPAYEAELLSYEPIDYQHLVRYTRSPKLLVWLGNDALSKDDVRMAAVSFRLGYHGYVNSAGNPQSVGLLSHMLEVLSDPHRGFSIGRGQAWGFDAAVSAYAMTDDPLWRWETREWLSAIVEMIDLGQSTANGFIQSRMNQKQFDFKYRFRSSMECAILEHALRGMRETVFEDVHPTHPATITNVLRQSYYAMVSDMSWWPGENNPWAHVGLGPANGDWNSQWTTHAEQLADLPMGCPSPECVTGNSGFQDDYQIGASLAYAYQLTGDQLFLDKALVHTKSALPGQTLLDKLEFDKLLYIENRAPLLALAQALASP